MFRSIACLFGRHTRDGRRIWNDGLDFRSSCRGCGRPMIRDLHGWREFDNATDLDAARDAKP